MKKHFGLAHFFFLVSTDAPDRDSDDGGDRTDVRPHESDANVDEERSHESDANVDEERHDDGETPLVDEEPTTPREPPFRHEVYPDREVIVEFDPDLTFECVDECTWCCHHGVLLYDDDLLELAARANLAETTTQFRGEPFVKREGKDRDEHVASDGNACAFLRGDGLCTLHLEEDWKPTRCSVFPLGVWRDEDGLHVDIRESAHEYCEGLGVSERRVLEHLDSFLPELLWELEDPDSDRLL